MIVTTVMDITEFARVYALSLPASGESEVEPVKESLQTDFSGINYVWLMRNAILDSCGKYFRGRKDVPIPRVFFVNRVVIIGPFSENVKNELDIVHETYSRLVLRSERYLSEIVAYVRQRTGEYFSIGTSPFEQEDVVSYVRSNMKGESVRCIPDIPLSKSPDEPREGIITLYEFLTRYQADTKHENIVLFKKNYAYDLLEQLCLLYILKVGGVNMSTIMIHENTLEPSILDISGRRSVVTTYLPERVRGHTFYFDLDPLNTRVLPVWTRLVSDAYPYVAEAVEKYDLSGLDPTLFFDAEDLRDICVGLLKYYSPTESLPESFGIGEEEMSDLSNLFDMVAAASIPLGKPSVSIKGLITSSTILPLIVEEKRASARKQVREVEKKQGGMSKEGIRTYSFNDPALVYEDRRKLFELTPMLKVLQYYIRINDRDKAMVCATEAYRVREYAEKGDPSKRLTITLLASLFNDVSVANPTLTMTIINSISQWKGDESLTVVCDIVAALCDSPKTRYFTDIWKVYFEFSRKELMHLGVSFKSATDNYVIEFDKLVESGEDTEEIAYVASVFKSLDPKYEPYVKMATLFYVGIVNGDYSAIEWLRKYYEYSTETTATNKKVNSIVRVTKKRGEVKEETIAPLNFIIDVLRKSFIRQASMFEIVASIYTLMKTAGQANSLPVIMYLTFMVGYNLENVDLLPKVVTNNEVDDLLEGKYPVYVESIADNMEIINYLVNGRNSSKYYEDAYELENTIDTDDEDRHHRFFISILTKVMK